MAEINAQQRAQLFAMSTRQNRHMLAKQTAVSVPNTLNFNLPKNRLLAGLMVKVKATFGGAQDVELEKLPYLIRRISLDLNNGFAPFVVSGGELALYNMIDVNAKNMKDSWCVKKVSGTVYDINFMLPCTTNPRDPIGLILLQNESTNVNLTLDIGMGSECGCDDPTKVEVKVMTETFSVPAHANAYPDLSVLKLVNGRKDSLPTAGQQIVKLPTGTIYRKLIFKLSDADGNPMKIEHLPANIELVFNQADINYSIEPEMLRLINEKELGVELPEGVYVFDFSNGGGFANMGGTRDFIDSSNLSEFWLRFTTNVIGKCEIVTETLSRLS